MTKVIAIRPEPGLSKTVELGRDLSLDIVGHPLFEVWPVDYPQTEVEAFDGLLIGSANAFRHGGSQLEAFRHLPVLAVGDATAELGRELGFRIEKVGTGGLQKLLDELEPKCRHLLRLTGRNHVDLHLPAYITIKTRVVYEVRPLDLSSDFVADLQDKPLILLHSGEAAHHLSSECDRLGIDRGSITLAAIGPRVLDHAGAGWAEAKSANQPNDEALLALAKDMCH